MIVMRISQMHKLIFLVIFISTSVFIGCAGGSRGTGIRLDRQLVDNPPLNSGGSYNNPYLSQPDTDNPECEGEENGSGNNCSK